MVIKVLIHRYGLLEINFTFVSLPLKLYKFSNKCNFCI